MKKMESSILSVFSESSILCEILKLLDLAEICKICSTNKTFNSLLTNQYFWKVKLKHDYNIDTKKHYLSWLDRYKLACKAGNIYVHQSSSSLVSDIGEEFNFGRTTPYYDNEDMTKNRLINIRAIKAQLDRDCLCYLNDDCELYMIEKSRYTGEISTQFIDDEVTDFILHTNVYYLRKGDVYEYNCEESEKKKLRLTYRKDVISIYVSQRYDLAYITKDNKCYCMSILDREFSWIKPLENVRKVLQYFWRDFVDPSNDWVFLTTDGDVQVMDAWSETVFTNSRVNDAPKLRNVSDINECYYVADTGKIMLAMGRFDYQGYDKMELSDEFDGISGIISICFDESIHRRICLTKWGKTYISVWNEEFSNRKHAIPFVENVKSIHSCPECIVMIL